MRMMSSSSKIPTKKWLEMRVVSYEDEVTLDEDGLTPDEGCLISYDVALIPLWDWVHPWGNEGVLIKAKGLTHQGVSQKAYIFFMKAVQRCLSVWYRNWAVIVWKLQTPLSGFTSQRPSWPPCADSQTATHSHHHLGAWRCWSWPYGG